MEKGVSMAPQVDTGERWVCFCVSERFSNKEHYQAVREELKKILGRNSEVLIVGEEIGEDCFENALGNYVFVRCREIRSKCKKLEESRYIKTCLNSFTDIKFIEQREMDEMTEHWRSMLSEKTQPLRFGDVVQVRSGTYDKLYGVVTGRVGTSYTVRFRLFSKDITSEFPANMLIQGVNVFHTLKFPVKK